MALVRDLSSAQITFQVGEGTEDQFSVLRFRGSEGLCQLYRFEIEAVCDAESADLDAVVGKSAVLRINTISGPRRFHGVVSRMELTGEADTRTYVRIELVPLLWLLTHRYNSRIFQAKTTQEIITDVLTRAGIKSDQMKFLLEGSYSAREYCVQYRETDYNFICRLMEEEGIWWTFEQTDEDHILIVADSVSAYQPIEGDSAALPYRSPTGMVVNTELPEHVFRFRKSQAVRPGAVVVNDFNFENPKLKLEAKADAGRDKALEFSDYPGEYTEQSRGTQIAGLRKEEFEASRKLSVGQSNSGRLSPSRVFELTEHPNTAMNGEYLVTAVMHQGKQAVRSTSSGGNGQSSLLHPRLRQALVAARQDANSTVREIAESILQVADRIGGKDPTANRALAQWLYHGGQVIRDLSSAAVAAGGSPLAAATIPNLIEDVLATSLVDFDAPIYECRFDAVPSAVVYRPARVTPWPVIRGTQTARVCGPDGEEIYTDKYGRVKVQFNWDREGTFNESSSCWIRVSQGMAGGNYGMMFLPRIGQEVIVDFLEGDPDKPIIIGRVYNADQMPPYTLPDEKTKSVIETRTTPGGEGWNELRFEDKKDNEQIFMYGHKDLDIRLNNDEKNWIGRDKHEIIKANQKKKIEKSESRAVGGDQATSVGGARSLKVKGDSMHYAQGNNSLTADADLYLVGAKAGLYGDSYAEVSAAAVYVEGDKITLKSGANWVVIDGSGVHIHGGVVNINSGGGPGSAQDVAIAVDADPAEPLEAATGDPGQDTTYQKEAEETDPLEYAPVHNEEESIEKHWIGIRLWDDNGQPLPGERYIVVLPDGTKVAKGYTDDKGEAEIRGIDPGSCEVKFPDLDGLTWEPGPAPTDAAGGAAPGGGAAPAAPGGAPAAPGGVPSLV